MRESVYTQRVDGTGRWYLGQLGHVDGLTYSDAIPGGAESATLTLQRDPSQRHEAFAPGRRLVVLKGSAQWEGTLTEPVPGDGGWALTADGAGTWGNRFRAIYTPPWGSNTPHDVISSAIIRGLRWVEGNLGGADITQPSDSAAQSVTEFMDGITSGVSWSWRVKRTHAGLQVDLFQLPDPKPSTCTRLLVTTAPVARTLAGYVNAMYARYQATADTDGAVATFGLGSAVNQTSINAHDRHEEFWDLTSAGTLSGAAVNVKAAQALTKYSAASYSSSITVHRGQYMTAGGAPVDLGCEKAGEVVKLIVADGPYGGELRTGPICFTVGRVNYSSDDDTLEITPLQSWRNTLSDVLTLIAPKAPA